MKKFFESIKIELHWPDVLPEAVAVRALEYKVTAYMDALRDELAFLAFSDRPAFSFVPRANGSRRSRSSS